MSRSPHDAVAHHPLASESAEDNPQPSVEESVARSTVGTACWILAHQRLAADILGHVSMRAGGDSIWIAARRSGWNSHLPAYRADWPNRARTGRGRCSRQEARLRAAGPRDRRHRRGSATSGGSERSTSKRLRG